MKTPIADFVENYRAEHWVRLHMPGHKGVSHLGCEPWDITEVHGADALYEADGIIAESEQHATTLFGTQRTCFMAEGSSQGIRTMLALALRVRRPQGRPLVLAARNVHKSFIHACALLDLDVQWLYPAEDAGLCRCPITAEQLKEALSHSTPMAVYITSPDYLGGMADLRALAAVCRAHDVPLLVDNAHGAYLRFLSPSQHPMDCGATMCCDSAHKTLPVLTGGAYLHVAQDAPEGYARQMKEALALFGSTSPSYLILQSLDLCNRWLAEQGAEAIRACADRTATLRERLIAAGLPMLPSEPLKLALDAAAMGLTGAQVAEHLRSHRVECEFADHDTVVFMVSADTSADDDAVLFRALTTLQAAPAPRAPLAFPPVVSEQVMTLREAVLAPSRMIAVEDAVGRVCAAPAVACPPAIPIVISGERITEEHLLRFRAYGQQTVAVVD